MDKIDTILNLMTNMPSGRIDPRAFGKLCAEYDEWHIAARNFAYGQSIEDIQDFYLETADVAYMSIKLIQWVADQANLSFNDVLDVVITKYSLRAQPNNPKDIAAERAAVKGFVVRP